MSRIGQLFASKEREFFDLFEEAARNCVRAAGLLEHMLEEWPDNGEAPCGKFLVARRKVEFGGVEPTSIVQSGFLSNHAERH